MNLISRLAILFTVLCSAFTRQSKECFEYQMDYWGMKIVSYPSICNITDNNRDIHYCFNNALYLDRENGLHSVRDTLKNPLSWDWTEKQDCLEKLTERFTCTRSEYYLYEYASSLSVIMLIASGTDIT